MGTTLDALANGSVSYRYVVAIEGFSYLLTNAPVAAAVAAWAGTDWMQALEGLFVDLDQRGVAHPWEPLQPGGTCTLRMKVDAADVFGTACAYRPTSPETYLTATIDRAATTVPVVSTVGFATSGEAQVGTECFAYTGVTSASFTGVTRGKFSPFASSTTARWAQYHRQGVSAVGVSLSPRVTPAPFTWVGRFVGVWAHRELGGVLDVKAQAQLLFAGRIDEIRDDATTLSTVVQLKSVMDILRDSSVGRDLYSAEIADGMYLSSGMSFSMHDTASNSGGFPIQRTANTLDVIASGASGANQANAGWYTNDDVYSLLNSWLAAEVAAGRLWGTYRLGLATLGDDLRSKIYWRVSTSSPAGVAFELRMPYRVGIGLGFTAHADTVTGTAVVAFTGQPFTDYISDGDETPLRAGLLAISLVVGVPFTVTNEVGLFADQYALMPASCRPAGGSGGLAWGVFLLDEKTLFVASYAGGVITNVKSADGLSFEGTTALVTDVDFHTYSRTVADPTPLKIRQIFVLEASLAKLLKLLFYSSGTTGYNGASDAAGYGLGIGVPGELLGTGFDASCDGLPGATSLNAVIVDKPLKLVDLLSSGLVLRWSFPRWKQGALSFASWVTPVPALGQLALDESTKSEQRGDADFRTVSVESTEYQRNVVKIQYNRDLSKPFDDAYTSLFTLVDNSAVDDQGGEAALVTLKARDTFGQIAQTGAGIEALAPGFLAQWPMFSRPFHKLTRSIAPGLFEQVAPGDVVQLADGFARDPATGRRGVSSRAALVIRARSNRGGAQASGGQPVGAQGEVDLLVLNQDRIVPYAYAADVDETASSGGFTAGYDSTGPSLRCAPHAYSESTSAHDAAFFASGDKVLIVERDPASPAAPLSWSRTLVAAPSGDDLTLSAALTSPSFDATKRYRVTFDHYAIATATQQAKAYQADDADARIEDLATPDLYGADAFTGTFTTYDPSKPAELVPDACYGDGRALDVGHEGALVQLLNLLTDYRCARQLPLVVPEVQQTAYSSGYALLLCYPINLSSELLAGGLTRVLTVAPQIRSLTGASVTVRVTLARTPPVEATLNDLTRPPVRSEALFTTTSSTYVIPVGQQLDERVKAANGDAWIWIEGTVQAATRGLTQCSQGPRQ